MKGQDILHQLQTLDINNPGGWPAWVRSASAILLAFLVLAAGIYALVRPVYESLKQEEGREQELRASFESKQRKAAALDAYKEQLAEMERSFGAMLKQLPSRSEVANLLNDISQTRVAASLEEELFRPEPERPKEFYAELPNRIVVLGTYQELAHFVSAIAALPRIVTIDDVEISVASGRSEQGKQLRMQAMATTYRYLDEGDGAGIKSTAPKGKNKGGKGKGSAGAKK